jgi:DNA-3-methyladenine glycosylase II
VADQPSNKGMKRRVPFDEDPHAVEHLRAVDPVLAGVIDAVGKPKLRPPLGSIYEALGRAILYQQLAGPAAASIERRFKRLYDSTNEDGRYPTPQELLATDDETLRGAGLSRQKLSYLKDLAARALDGTVSFDVDRLEDDEIVDSLSQIKGIGRWSVEMLLIFELRRPDVLPVDDLGVRNSFKRLYDLPEPPGHAQMREIAEPWRPHRSLGTWYLWQSTRFVLMGETNVAVGS